MKTIYILLAVTLLSVSCGEKVNEQRFFDLYRDILVIRNQDEDTALANPKVRELFERYDYPEEQFKKDFYTLGNKDEKFANKVDSLRKFIIDGKK